MKVNADYFDELYKAADDTPWQNEDTWYEERKRHILLASLTKRHYNHAFELGCGIGFNTEPLAARCKNLLSCDFSPVAIQSVQQQLANYKNIQYLCLKLPHEWPADSENKFDLIVVSEFAYYLNKLDFKQLLNCCVNSLNKGGELLFCNWLPKCHDRIQDTEQIHLLVNQHLSLHHQLSHKEEFFWLDVWLKKA